MEYLPAPTLLEWVLRRYEIPWRDGKEDVRWRIKNDPRIMDAFETFRASGDEDCVCLRRELRSAYNRVHRRHIVHNDVKPANMLCCVNGSGRSRIWLLDFEEATVRWDAQRRDRVECRLWFGG